MEPQKQERPDTFANPYQAPALEEPDEPLEIRAGIRWAAHQTWITPLFILVVTASEGLLSRRISWDEDFWFIACVLLWMSFVVPFIVFTQANARERWVLAVPAVAGILLSVSAWFGVSEVLSWFGVAGFF